MRCVFNGVTANEFDPVATADDATDIVYVGEFRHIKGTDLLIDAPGRGCAPNGKPVTLDPGRRWRGKWMRSKAQIQRLGLTGAVRFIGHVQPRYGFLEGPAAGGAVAWGFDALCGHRGPRAAGIPMVCRQSRRHP